jgi:putative membrane protein
MQRTEGAAASHTTCALRAIAGLSRQPSKDAHGKVSAYDCGLEAQRRRDRATPRWEDAMKHGKPLCALMLSSFCLAACSKQGSSPEAESAYTAQAERTTVETTIDPIATTSPPAEAPYQPAPIAGSSAAEALPSGGPPPASAEPVALSDAQIVKVTETLDQGEIEQAKEAQKKSKNPQVKKLASHMITQHTKAQKKGASLAKKAQLTPETSAVAAELGTKAEETLQTLKSATPGELDHAYVNAQVRQHETALDLFETRLIPSAVNADLKAQLEETRNMIQQHIEQARKVQEALSAVSAAPPAS